MSVNSNNILLGYEVPSGKPVYIQPHHLAAFGLTQKSGKTTILNGLIHRSGLKGIAFITKRGEAGFVDAHLVKPYYKHQTGWQYIESLVDVALGEKVKYEPKMRYAIMRIAKKSKDLGEARQVCHTEEKTAKRAWDREVYAKLGAYLDLVLPELEKVDFADSVKLQNGTNAMNLVGLQLQTQQLIIASTLRYIYENLEHTIVILPEAWEMLPQSRKTPVKLIAEQFIRKGASVNNYLWLDSQDIGGIDKTPLRQVSTWILGRMMEAHEVERIGKQLLGVKVKASEIQTLPLGHFYVTVGREVKKVYALPKGVPEEEAVAVALGKKSPEEIRDRYLLAKIEEEDVMYKEKFEEEKRVRKELEKTLGDYSKQVKELQGKIKKTPSIEKLEERILDLERQLDTQTEEYTALLKKAEVLNNLQKALEPLIVARALVSGKRTVNLENVETTFNVKHSEETVELSTKTQQGQIIYCAVHDLEGKAFTEKEMSSALKEHGWNIAHSSLAPQLSGNLTKAGLLIKNREGRNVTYRLPSKIKVNVAD